MKIILRIFAVIILLIAGFVVYVQLAWNKKFEAPYPEIKASTDSAVIARGKYLVYGPAHCATCHVPMDKLAAVEKGEIVPLIGGWELDIPPGTFRALNLTPDMETGIGKLTDGEIARTLRHGVGSDGRAILAFMPFEMMSDEDMTAVISFLRSQQPVHNPIKRTEYKFLGKALFTLGIIKPEGAKETPPKTVVRDSTVEYGHYLVYNVANCRGCHSNRSMMTGAYTGPDLAGGHLFMPDKMSEGYAFVPPNLTPDTETGLITSWDENKFIERFRAGRVFKTSPMPWGSFSRLDELDLKALYRYLHSIEPVKRKVEKCVYLPGEELPDIE